MLQLRTDAHERLTPRRAIEADRLVALVEQVGDPAIQLEPLRKGDAGADVYLFSAAPGLAEAKLIHGFAPGEDRIAILATAFDPTLMAGALDPSRFEANARGQASTAGQGVFVFETDKAWLWWDTDGAGAGRELVARFGTPAPLDVADFIVI